MPVNTLDKLEKEAVEWLETVTGEQFDQEKTFQQNLKDGTILCKAFNTSFVDMKVKYTHSAMPFKQMENIATFLHALSKLPNFRSFDLFSTVDLYEGKNLSSVTRCILVCKRIAEKEAIAKGIEVLNVSNMVEVVEPEKFDEPEVVFEAEVMEQTEAFEEDKVLEETEVEIAVMNETNNYTADPEIILVDSPVFADDEAEPIIRNEQTDEFVEYETFTVNNPGTFEIQVSDE